MKLTAVRLKNFRGYRNETTIELDDFTILVGRNDAGKSSILDALDIYFNGADVDNGDACVHGSAEDVRISCVFGDLPVDLVLDDQHPTTLQDEYLVRGDGMLEICRVYNCSGSKSKLARTFARANHPTSSGVADLLTLKLPQLKARARERAVNLTGVNESIKTQLRRAIWQQAADLALAETEVDLTSESAKTAWDQIQQHLPVFALFKSDRASTDQDAEAQDPMKAAIKETVRAHETQLGTLIGQVRSELERVARRTVEKIQEMSPDLARTLDPQVKTKNWDSLFSVSLTGDDGISINKRGSGTRRLVLLNFFRAKAEDASSAKGTGTIYAVEEPETSQHPNHQLLLLDAFEDLTADGRAQVILTTHTPTLARRVSRDRLRLVRMDAGSPVIEYGRDDATLDKIRHTLGVLADHDIKVFVGLEGKWDIEFLTRISRVLHLADPTIPDLAAAEAAGTLMFVPLGGSSMELWATRLARLDRPEFYLTDRDKPPPDLPKYHAQIAVWNSRNGCSARCTNKAELENYIHPQAIRGLFPSFPPAIADFDDVPMILAEKIHVSDPAALPWANVTPDNRKKKESSAKRRLNTDCVDRMTPALLAQSDPTGEIVGFLRDIAQGLAR